MTTLHPRPGAGLWLIPAPATIVHLRGELDFATGHTLDIALGLATPRPHLSKVPCLTGLDRSFAMYRGSGRAGAGAAAAR